MIRFSSSKSFLKMKEEERMGDPGEVLPLAERFGKQPLKCF